MSNGEIKRLSPFSPCSICRQNLMEDNAPTTFGNNKTMYEAPVRKGSYNQPAKVFKTVESE